MLPNPNACWDWVGWYGFDADQKGGTLTCCAIAKPSMLTFIPCRRSHGGHCQPSQPDPGLAKPNSDRREDIWWAKASNNILWLKCSYDQEYMMIMNTICDDELC